jgi:GNAT superfamily N-acetyltransferase
MSDELVIRPYISGDEEAICDLFHLTFGQSLDMAAWRWRFQENPYGGPLIELMWDGNKLVGQYAVSPLDMSIDGETYSCALSLDTMTHPDYGGRGIFTRLATSLYDRISGSGYALVWGFPNENSHHGFVKRLAWLDIATIPMLCLRSNLDRHPQKTIRPLDNYDSQVDALFKQEQKRWKCLTVRSARYLNWRFFHRPGRHYYAAGVFSGDQLVGYSVYKLFKTPGQTVGDIVDVFCTQDGDIFGDLIAWTVQELFRQGAQAVNMWMNEHSPFYPVVQEMGFLPDAPHTFLGERVFASKLLAERLAEWENWFIHMGDSDVY